MSETRAPRSGPHHQPTNRGGINQPIYQPLSRHLDAISPPHQQQARSTPRVPAVAKEPRNWKNLWRITRLLSLLAIGGVFVFALNDAIPRHESGSETPSYAGVPFLATPEMNQTATATVIVPTPKPKPKPKPKPAIVANPLFARTVVCLDPGHGGDDPGYARKTGAPAGALTEAAYNLAFALELRDRLEAHGFSVVLTRNTAAAVNDRTLDVNQDGKTGRDGASESERHLNRNLDELGARIKICNAAGADLLVSIHINGYPDATVGGYETWFNSSRPFHELSGRFAEIVFDQLGIAMQEAGYEAVARGVNDDKTAKTSDPHQQLKYYVVLGPAQAGVPVPSTMPGAIVESLFISNDADYAFLATEAGQEAIITAYEQAIVQYFEETLDSPK